MINGNISKSKEGKFKTVSSTGRLIFEIPIFVKNFNSSKIFKINIKEENINVI
tara:strand:- start:356 stop:514 length:159 start_codon:yes stop_codon:yes gene_type:complete